MASTLTQASDLHASRGSLKAKTGLKIARHFTRPGANPYDEIEWEQRTASIANEKGKVVFEQSSVEIPKAWSQMATNVVVSKYFRGPLGSPEREYSVRQMIGRAAYTEHAPLTRNAHDDFGLWTARCNRAGNWRNKVAML